MLPFEDLSAEDLASLLKEFYYCVRTKDNKEYSRSAFKGIRAGLQRHLEGRPFCKKFAIQKDREFCEANQVFNGYMCKIQREGKDKKTLKKTILPGDITKLYTTVFNDTPQGLLYRVFYEITQHFGQRGRETLRDFKPNSLKLCVDDDGQEYFQQTCDEVDTDDKRIITSMPDNPQCPVKHIKKFLSKLHPGSPALFQHPMKKYTDNSIWYDTRPIGKNALDCMMRRMSEAGNLSQIYTNSCIGRT